MDENRLNEIVSQAVGDFGSLLTGALVVLGDRLDLRSARHSALKPARRACVKP